MRNPWLAAIAPTALLILFWLHGVAAYEIKTHRQITQNAFEQSVLNQGYLDRELGFSADRVLKGRNVRQWLKHGSEREDDTLSLNLLRFRHHFYDPVYDRGLTGKVGETEIAVGERAFDWALEESRDFLTQQFSWRDARHYFLKGLTEPTPSARERELANTFRTLGHVMHLIQDMGAPAHTRNDWHAGKLAPFFPFGPPSLFETHIDNVREGLPYTGYPRPPFRQLRQFWTTGDGRGFAEFTNRNFVSEGSNFTRVENGATGHDPVTKRNYPSPQLFLDRKLNKTTLSGTPLEGTVTFFLNDVDDRVTGQLHPDRLMTTLSLFDNELLKRGKQLIFTLNKLNVTNAAHLLLPRATGYSAGLLDYFFRGKLDVDLIEDATDPSVVQLAGNNASDDPLTDGTIKLYADDPSGRRSEAAPLSPTSITAVDKGQQLPALRYQVPGDAERFVAVYQGTLGQELKDPSRNFPGGVIGKVIGGVRVEEVFSDGTNWKLRTPKGVFLLKDSDRLLTNAEFEEVKWGDGDHILVARTPFGRPDTAQPNRRNRMVVYEIQRQPGSVEPVTVETPDGPEAQVRKKTEAQFPFGMSLGTTVQFSQTIQYRQQLAKVDPRKTVLRFEPQPTPSCPGCGSYVFDHFEIAAPQIETVMEQTIPFSETFLVRLDLEHNSPFGTVSRPYQWSLEDVTADASGRLLGVVVVFLIQPESQPVTVPFFHLNQAGALEVRAQHPVSPHFPQGMSRLLWAVVDLNGQFVVASTAEPQIMITSEAVEENPDWRAIIRPCSFSSPLVSEHIVEQRIGGPQAGLEDRGWLGRCTESVPPGTALSLTEIQNEVGERALSADGWLRTELKDELTKKGLLNFQVDVGISAIDVLYDCPTPTCLGLHVTTSSGFHARPLMELEDVRRSRPAPGGERLVFRARDVRTPLRIIMVWDASPPRAQVLEQFPRDIPLLGSATLAGLLATTHSSHGGQILFRGFLFPLEGDQSPIVFEGVDFRDAFTLLDPSFLYSTQDLRFFRAKPPLLKTALPAKLAGLPDGSNPVGDYHAIRVP